VGGGVTFIPRWSGPPPPKPILPPSSGYRQGPRLPKSALPPSSGHQRDIWGPPSKGGHRGQPARAQRSAAVDLEHLHEVIQTTVGRAVAEIAYAEEQRSETDLAKRIVKYVYKAAADPELLQLPWEAVCREVVERSMRGYSASCGEAPWFFSIDLPPVFCAAVWEILGGSGQSHLVSPDTVHDVVVLEYDAKLDRMLLEKAMWEVASRTFSDDKVKSKVFQAISRSYWPALDDALVPALMQEEMRGGLTEDQESRHVEAFTKKWITEAMNRAWGAVEQVGAELTGEIIVELFENLIAPFGDEDPFTCIPGALSPTIGRPPPDWPFIAQAVEELLSSWADSAARSYAKKRRRGNDDGEEEAAEEAEGIVEVEPDEQHPKAKAKNRAKVRVPTLSSSQHPSANANVRKFRGFNGRVKEDDELDGESDVEGGDAEDAEDKNGGHPRCTSEEDCIGTPDSQLVQHILNGEAGDIYCEPCWNSFSRRNPTLQGKYVTQ